MLLRPIYNVWVCPVLNICWAEVYIPHNGMDGMMICSRDGWMREILGIKLEYFIQSYEPAIFPLNKWGAFAIQPQVYKLGAQWCLHMRQSEGWHTSYPELTSKSNFYRGLIGNITMFLLLILTVKCFPFFGCHFKLTSCRHSISGYHKHKLHPAKELAVK